MEPLEPVELVVLRWATRQGGFDSAIFTVPLDANVIEYAVEFSAAHLETDRLCQCWLDMSEDQGANWTNISRGDRDQSGSVILRQLSAESLRGQRLMARLSLPVAMYCQVTIRSYVELPEEG